MSDLCKIVLGAAIGVVAGVLIGEMAWRLGNIVREDRHLALEMRAQVGIYKPFPPLQIEDELCEFPTITHLGYTVSCGTYRVSLRP